MTMTCSMGMLERRVERGTALRGTRANVLHESIGLHRSIFFFFLSAPIRPALVVQIRRIKKFTHFKIIPSCAHRVRGF